MGHMKEFFLTYGWAILVVGVAIAALAFFGVLSPDKFLPQDRVNASEHYTQICENTCNFQGLKFSGYSYNSVHPTQGECYCDWNGKDVRMY